MAKTLKEKSDEDIEDEMLDTLVGAIFGVSAAIVGPLIFGPLGFLAMSAGSIHLSLIVWLLAAALIAMGLYHAAPWYRAKWELMKRRKAGNQDAGK